MIIAADKYFKHNVEKEMEFKDKTKLITKLRQMIVFIICRIIIAAILFRFARLFVEKCNFLEAKGNFN